jgi:hypothetical protein
MAYVHDFFWSLNAELRQFIWHRLQDLPISNIVGSSVKRWQHTLEDCVRRCNAKLHSGRNVQKEGYNTPRQNVRRENVSLMTETTYTALTNSRYKSTHDLKPYVLNNDNEGVSL